MDRGLISNLNQMVSSKDTIYHLGDFCFTRDSLAYGKAMHLIHGKTVFLRGNHDIGLQHASYFICRRIEGMKIFMRHWPPWERPVKFTHSFNIPLDVDLILCGHVHNKWKFHVHCSGQRRVPVVNIGLDAWNYRPVTLDIIMEEVDRFIASKRRR